VAKTIEEINEKIAKGKAVVVTAEEMIEIVREKGTKSAASEVDVVTTGTFAPMCSSGALLNLGHPKPRMKIEKAWLNGVPAYAGMAAVDIYLGASALPDEDPRNVVYPGKFKYGGGHVIEELIAGKDVMLKATGYGTDCYPRRELETWINLQSINEAFLLNPRNCYQNYLCAVNLSDRVIYTYMGVLKPNLGNANYCSAGQLSPLLNDPFCRTIGIGTRIFLGGGVGYVISHGTQHNPHAERNEKGIVKQPGATLALIGDMKKMSPYWVRGVSMLGYGVSLALGIGIPIPIIDEEMAMFTGISDKDITTTVVDFSHDYPYDEPRILEEVTYKELKSGKIKIMGKEVPTAPLSSYPMARKIASILKEWILRGDFYLTKPVAQLPDEKWECTFKGLFIRAPK